MRLDEMKTKATHRNIVTGTLFKLSKPDDDFHGLAWWLNEASKMWQVSSYSDSNIAYGKDFELVA
ncbi:hypothetical protein [Sulfurovum sp.]|uniref:hypothetical protein n=1 Tax=Sulfurovum sp. TaxID=1969726 RepID=UPI003568A01C